jgi:hypothetical protein
LRSKSPDPWDRFFDAFRVWSGGALWIGRPASGADTVRKVVEDLEFLLVEIERCGDRFLVFVPAAVDPPALEKRFLEEAKRRGSPIRFEERIDFRPGDFEPWIRKRCADRAACARAVKRLPRPAVEDLERAGAVPKGLR